MSQSTPGRLWAPSVTHRAPSAGAPQPGDRALDGSSFADRSGEPALTLGECLPIAHAALRIIHASAIPETYVEMLRQVRLFLRHGESVVLDASWTSAHWRKAATELAREAGALLIELRCVAPPLLATDRIRDRAREATDPSDANEEVAAGMALEADPWPTANVVDTSGPPEDGLDAALLAIYHYPARASSRPPAPTPRPTEVGEARLASPLGKQAGTHRDDG